mgnify:CR=1 FL=1|jgi:hypothetical protein
MELQKTFKESYTATLKDNVKSGVSIPLYGEETFPVDKSQIKRLAGVYAVDGLGEKMLSYYNDDFMAAKTLYEAYENISPLLASNESFWVYLTHTELFEYMKKRWPNVKLGTASSNYILDHWFVGGQGLMRNAAANLWWTIHNTIDNTREDRYELSSLMFKNYTLRTNTFGISTLIRHREAMIGILEFILENPIVTKDFFEARGTFIAKYFNRLGAVKQLAYLDRDYFKHKCENMKDKILNVTSREQVVNDESLYND